ncbi:3-oxoacyl-ACP reductase [Burkholderia stabilis]|uniref:3-oxoacyl-ACP reductase n=1 Tax=Burkholderia stabilis TaxID=95485 RepID=A0A1Y1BR58_9BURK|nr:3-oxoacyl-ACP reductase [Burkholderia stabilis]
MRVARAGFGYARGVSRRCGFPSCAPVCVIEALQDLVTEDGLIGAMSSGQGSVANNVSGMRAVYRGSKAALNQFMRSFAARQADTPRAWR